MKKGKGILLFFSGVLLIGLGFFSYVRVFGIPVPFYRNETQVGMDVKPVKVTEDTEIYIQEVYRLCSQAGLDCTLKKLLEGQERLALNGMTPVQLESVYSPVKGWKQSWQLNGQGLLISRELEGFCELHSGYWHFEVSAAGMVQVYQGPGGSGKLGEPVLSTSIAVADLPEDYAAKISEGRWEFRDWEYLQAVLDNFES
ncbi:MAG: hypothetical protein VB085_13040 [Peptococcaceae bacterium]|nr:hypothetical protein [Peptococcaceae bacterium]